MKMQAGEGRIRGFMFAAAVTGCIASASAYGQPMGITFSVDFQGPTAGNFPGPFTGIGNSFTGDAIDEGMILTVSPPGPPGPNMPTLGPPPPPGTIFDATFGGAGGSYVGNLGILPFGPFDAVEVDALSYGRDSRMGMVFFSVDEWAGGDQLTGPGPMPPDVFTEGATGAREAAADVFKYLGPGGPWFPGGPIPPVPFGAGNTAVYDGDGAPGLPFGTGLGLIEPIPALPGYQNESGDNLDALDKNTSKEDLLGVPGAAPGFVFFSMDAQYPDPLETAFGALLPPPNTATAVSNGFVGGDVVVASPVAGIGPTLYVPASVLGLDEFGPDTDDLDALVLKDDGAIDPATGLPFFSPSDDFILFSVRRGSGVIGLSDSRFGLPIEEGDILTIAAAAGAPPAIFIPAEELGLGTLRSGTASHPDFGDELDALDVFFHLLGDANGDMAVTADDLIAVQQNFGTVGAMDGMLPGDANGDGAVTADDLIAVQQNFGMVSTDAPVSSAVPEPAGVALLALGCAAAIGRSRSGERMRRSVPVT